GRAGGGNDERSQRAGAVGRVAGPRGSRGVEPGASAAIEPGPHAGSSGAIEPGPHAGGSGAIRPGACPVGDRRTVDAARREPGRCGHVAARGLRHGTQGRDPGHPADAERCEADRIAADRRGGRTGDSRQASSLAGDAAASHRTGRRRGSHADDGRDPRRPVPPDPESAAVAHRRARHRRGDPRTDHRSTVVAAEAARTSSRPATPPAGVPVRPTDAATPSSPRATPPAGESSRPAAAVPSSRRTPPPRPEPEPRPPPPPGMSDADVNALYAKYVKAKQILGEEAEPGTYGKLLKTINAQAPKIMEQYKSKGVDFSIVVKDNQVIIRAKPKP